MTETRLTALCRRRGCGILRRRLHSGRCGREDLLRLAVVRAIAAMQFDEQGTRNCSNRGTGGSELRISDAGAQTRIVSGGPVGRAKVSLSRDLNYTAGARIPEFEFCRPSDAVGLSASLLVSAGGVFRAAMPDRLSKAKSPATC
jgi:hypothetical protein